MSWYESLSFSPTLRCSKWRLNWYHHYGYSISNIIVLKDRILSGRVMISIWAITFTSYWAHLSSRQYQCPIGLVLKYRSPNSISYTTNVYHEECFHRRLIHPHSFLSLLLVYLIKPGRENLSTQWLGQVGRLYPYYTVSRTTYHMKSMFNFLES